MPQRSMALSAAGAVLCVLIGAVEGRAEIVSASPTIEVLSPAPASVLPGALESNVFIRAFSEQQNILLPRDLSVDINTPGSYASPASLTGGTIPAGTRISSHLLHIDKASGVAEAVISGSVTFSGPIIGIIVLGVPRGPTLDNSDLLGGGTLYPNGLNRRGLDWDPPPEVQEAVAFTAGDPTTLNVTMSSANDIDQVRVIILSGGAGEGRLTWSIDIGSDAELSDPTPDGNEGLDPGDCYPWRAPPLTPPDVPCGSDGTLDDFTIFGADPVPALPDCGVPPTSVVPIGTCSPACYNDYFDLDGHDQIDIDLRAYISPAAPLASPLRMITDIPASGCIFVPKYLLLSFDDDGPDGWPSGNVPVASGSPTGARHGTTVRKDEVVVLSLNLSGVAPFSPTSLSGFLAEDGVHPDLAPNPDLSEADDDDVDSLDYQPVNGGGVGCTYWYFSADQEARNNPPLDSGSIYLVTAGGPVLVIDDVIHLGLPESTDIDDFEFTWLRETETGPLELAVIFTVDDNDGLTGGDESGGRDPRVIMASFMTGSSFPLIPNGYLPHLDDIDGLAIAPEDPVVCVCPSDMNLNGTSNGLDAQPFVDCVLGSGTNCECADMNGDGVVNLVDVPLFVADLLNDPC